MSQLHQLERFKWLRDWVVSACYRRFDAIICESKDMAIDLTDNYGLTPDSMTVINSPFDTEGIPKRIAEATFAPKKAKFRFVSLGRLAAQKGLDRALHALAQLKGLDFEYLLIGEGNLRSDLEQLTQKLGIADRVQFLGMQTNPFGYLASADLMLLPSHFEGFPNVLGEAGVCGLPIIAFQCKGGINEIIVEGMNGFSVPDGDIAAFSDAILRGCQHDFNKSLIRQYISDNFNMRKIVGQHEAVFERVLNQKQ